jgi:hypothetical protein
MLYYLNLSLFEYRYYFIPKLKELINREHQAHVKVKDHQKDDFK